MIENSILWFYALLDLGCFCRSMRYTQRLWE